MKEENYRLGLVSVSFRKHTPKEILNAMQACGLSVIEWGSDVHAPCTDHERIGQIVAMQESLGISCSSYGTYFKLGQTPIGELPRYIDAAHRLKTDVLRLWCGTRSGDAMTAEERDSLLAQACQAAELAEREGVTLCMECHKQTFTERPEDALELMRVVNSKHFRMYWQPFQWLEAGENLLIAKKLSLHVEHLHVFQWKGTQRFSLHEGIGEWQEYLGALPAPRTLLLEFMPDDSLATLAQEADALRTIVSGLGVSAQKGAVDG